LPLFLHPVEVIGHERLGAYYLTNLLGNPFESAIAAAHLIFGVCSIDSPGSSSAAHAGGAFPGSSTAQPGWEKRSDLKHVKHSPIDYLRRFYYDTVGYSTRPGISGQGNRRRPGVDGSDYCFPIAYEQPVKIVVDHPSLDAEAKRSIVEANARRLLKL